MARSSENFNVVGLDFDDVKNSLKSFLQTQDTLKDYNFDGSVLSTILDVLAYNTHYQTFYANMVANEMFMDSAVLRPSIVSHAKQLGYTPLSSKASKAVLNLPITGGPVNSGTYLGRGTEFTGVDPQGNQYRFMLLDNVYANTTTNSFENVEVYEGGLRRVSYVYDSSNRDGSVLVIPNDKIDTSTIRLSVLRSGVGFIGAGVTGASGDRWTLASSYIDLTPTSKVFFLQEKEMGMYELYFGDDFLGQKPKDGDTVTIEYLETNGSAGNDISKFTHSVANLGTPTLVSRSSGGGEAESSNRIKFLAPKYYQSQHRAVTANDYKTTVFREYPNAGSVFVYGGETIVPPQYGKVFIAVKPKGSATLTDREKTTLITTLKDTYSVVGIVPEIVDPDYVDLVVDSVITYNPSMLTVSAPTVKAVAVAYAFAHSNIELNGFGSNFYYSKFTEGLNRINAAILSNQTKIRMRKTISVQNIVASKGITVKFGNSIYHPHDGHSISVISSNLFPHEDFDGEIVYGCTLIDNGSGRIDVVKLETENMETMSDMTKPSYMTVYPGVGNVDYTNGIITLSGAFAPVVPSELVYAIIITAQPEHQDLMVKENNILRISRGYKDSVNINMTPLTVSM